MVLTLAALSLMYYMRYGHFPLQDVWQRWNHSAELIIKELGVPGQAVTVDAGILRCTIKGKVVFSDVECSDNNPTTQTVKLVDNKGGEPPKPSANSSNSKAQDDAGVDVQSKIIDKAVQ